MTNIILLAICLVAGILLRKTGRFPAATPAALNGFIIYISLPTLAILHVHNLRLDLSLLLTIAMAWIVFGAGWLFFQAAGKAMKVDRKTLGALLLVGGLGNTSFVGLPMIEAYFGKELLGIGILIDQLGSFMILSTLGILTATIYSSGEIHPRQMLRKVLTFPPFQAILLAMLLRPVPFPPWTVAILQKLGDTLTPLALVSVGFQLQLGHLKGKFKPLALGLSYKLILAPALIWLIYIELLGGAGPVMQVTIFEAAMPPMITAGIIAMDHDLEPQLVSLMVGIGIPLAFVTLHIWHWLVQGI